MAHIEKLSGAMLNRLEHNTRFAVETGQSVGDLDYLKMLGFDTPISGDTITKTMR